MGRSATNHASTNHPCHPPAIHRVAHPPEHLSGFEVWNSVVPHLLNGLLATVAGEVMVDRLGDGIGGWLLMADGCF